MSLPAQIARRTPADLLLALEALALLAIFRVALRLVAFRRILRSIGRRQPDLHTAADTLAPGALETALRVRWAVESATRNAPIRFVCFPQALAAYTMLRRRGVAGTIVYGVARSPEGRLMAHTWLELGDRIVVGGEGSEAFQPIERWT